MGAFSFAASRVVETDSWSGVFNLLTRAFAFPTTSSLGEDIYRLNTNPWAVTSVLKSLNHTFQSERRYGCVNFLAFEQQYQEHLNSRKAAEKVG